MRLTNPNSQRPPIILDATAVGPRNEAAARFNSPSQTQNLLGVFRSYGHVAVDTARPASEALLGETDLADWALLDTTLPNEYAKVTASIDTSLDALCVQRLRVAYAPSATRANGDEDKVAAYWRGTCAEVHSAYEVRKVVELGLSQVASKDVELVAHLCADEGWLKPTVYRGTYNIAARDIEWQTLPVLREHGVRFHATDPFAGSLFRNTEDTMVEVPAAVAKVLEVAKLQHIGPRALALRWLLHHSALDERLGDALILPAVNLSQLEDDLRACDEGPLPEDLVEELEALHSTATSATGNITETMANGTFTDAT